MSFVRPVGGLTLTGGGGGGGLRSGRSSSLGLVKAASTVGGGEGAGGQEELIVLRKDDLNTILTAKPTLLIGRELVSLQWHWAGIEAASLDGA